MDEWRGFKGIAWKTEVNVRDFIQKNYTVYDGDESFLEEPTEATDKLWNRLKELQKEERAKGGVLDMETEKPSHLTTYGTGPRIVSGEDLRKKGFSAGHEYYLCFDLETDKPTREFIDGAGHVLKLVKSKSPYKKDSYFSTLK